MANLFQNIAQSANPLVGNSTKGKNNSAVSNIKEKGVIDFESTLAAISNSANKLSGPDQFSIIRKVNQSESHSSSGAVGLDLLPSNKQFLTGMYPVSNLQSVIKEKASINSQVLKVLLSNQKDQILIDFPQNEQIARSQFSSDGKSGLDNNLYFANISYNNDEKNIIPNISNNENLRLIIKPSDLFSPQSQNGQSVIPATVSGSNGNDQHAFVDVSKLMNLLREYPDPINMEISNVNNMISTSKEPMAGQSSTSNDASFIFDIRNLANLTGQNSSTQINGILKTVEQPSLAQTLINNVPSKNLSQSQSQPVNTATNTQNLVQASFTDPAAIIELTEVTPIKISISPEKSSPSTTQIAADNAGHETYFSLSDGVEKDCNSIPVNFHESVKFDKTANAKSHVQSDQNQAGKNSSAEQIIQTSSGDSTKTDSILPNISDPQPSASVMSARIEDIKSAIATALEKQLSSVKIRLQPDNLGSVSVKMTWKNNDLSIGFTTENKDAATLLNSNLADLKGGLESANLNIKEINVTIDDNHQNGNFNSYQNQSNGSHNNARHEQKGANPTEFAKRNHPMWSTINTLSANLSSNINPYGWIDLKA